MDLEKILETFIQLANFSQSKGILSLEEAVLLKQAKDSAIEKIAELKEATKTTEDDNN